MDPDTGFSFNMFLSILDDKIYVTAGKIFKTIKVMSLGGIYKMLDKWVKLGFVEKKMPAKKMPATRWYEYRLTQDGLKFKNRNQDILGSSKTSIALVQREIEKEKLFEQYQKIVRPEIHNTLKYRLEEYITSAQLEKITSELTSVCVDTQYELFKKFKIVPK